MPRRRARTSSRQGRPDDTYVRADPHSESAAGTLYRIGLNDTREIVRSDATSEDDACFTRSTVVHDRPTPARSRFPRAAAPRVAKCRVAFRFPAGPLGVKPVNVDVDLIRPQEDFQNSPRRQT